MPQTETDHSASSPSASAGDDQLSHLHKMSTTAGLGSTEYVAVNGAAVAAVLLGLASGLTLLEEFLLIIPLVCVVVSVVAWRQIAHSNGTETGKGLIVIGLLCAIGFGGFVVVRDATEGIRTRADRQAIGKVIADFGEKAKAGDFAGAYGLFSERFTQRVSQTEFSERLKFMRQSELYGKLKQVTWNGLVDFTTDESTNTRYGVAKMVVELEKTGFDDTLTFRKVGERWVIDGMNNLFPPPQQR